jgi:hypothetical protein
MFIRLGVSDPPKSSQYPLVCPIEKIVFNLSTFHQFARLLRLLSNSLLQLRCFVASLRC